MTEELTKCSEIFTGTGNYFELGAYAGFFIVTTVFAFMKKSIPSVIKSLLDAVVKAFSSKK